MILYRGGGWRINIYPCLGTYVWRYVGERALLSGRGGRGGNRGGRGGGMNENQNIYPWGKLIGIFQGIPVKKCENWNVLYIVRTMYVHCTMYLPQALSYSILMFSIII